MPKHPPYTAYLMLMNMAAESITEWRVAPVWTHVCDLMHERVGFGAITVLGGYANSTMTDHE